MNSRINAAHINSQQSAPNLMYYYEIFCLNVVSEFPISSLLPRTKLTQDQIDVQVQLDANLPEERKSEPDHFLFEKEDHWIEVVQGRKITFFPKNKIDPTRLSWYFLNCGIITILYQRGFLIFHGSCISNSHEAIAFFGKSGVGKSTTAAFFREKGFQYLGDDICALKVLDNGLVKIYPSYPEIGLWPHSSVFLDNTFSFEKRSRPYLDGKADFKITERFQKLPVRLKKIYILNPTDRNHFSIDRIDSGLAIYHLNEYALLYLSYLKVCNLFKVQFQRYIELLKEVELWKLERPASEDHRPYMMNLIQQSF